jgi:hypothetical protein
MHVKSIICFKINESSWVVKGYQLLGTSRSYLQVNKSSMVVIWIPGTKAQKSIQNK